MQSDIDLAEVDRGDVERRLTELERTGNRGDEYEALTWYRDILYLIDEGFLTVGDGGRLYPPALCPDTP